MTAKCGTIIGLEFLYKDFSNKNSDDKGEKTSMEVITEAGHYFYNLLTEEELWNEVGKALLRVILIIILAFVFKKLGNKVIDTIFKDRSKIPIKITTNRREQTLKNLAKSSMSYLIVFIAIMMILDAFHIPIRTMLAGAGVAGLAIGFGAQNLVRDIIAGFFIIFEDQFSVGDYIETGEIEGDVVLIGLRTTKLRSYYGQTYVIPNGSIEIVNNYSSTNGFAMVEINIPYESNIVQIEKMVDDILQTLPNKYDVFVDTPFINGVTTLDLSNYVLRVRGETTPVMQWEGARLIRKEVKEHLFEKGIEIPSPRMVVYSKEDNKSQTS